MPVYIFRKLTDKYNQILLDMAYEQTCSTANILLPPRFYAIVKWK